MTFLALVALFAVLFLMEGLWTMRRRKRKRNTVVRIRDRFRNYPGGHGLAERRGR